MKLHGIYRNPLSTMEVATALGEGKYVLNLNCVSALEHPTLPRPWVSINKKGEGFSSLTLREGRGPCLEEKIKGGVGVGYSLENTELIYYHTRPYCVMRVCWEGKVGEMMLIL